MADGSMLVAVVLLVQVLMMVTQSSGTVERPDHSCGKSTDGSFGKCDPKRCCSIFKFCGDGANCDWHNCLHFCPTRPPPPHPPRHCAAEASGGVELTGGRLVNVTYNHYLDDHIMTESPANSTSSSLMSTLPCASFISRLPLASRHKYPLAAFRAPLRHPSNVTSTTATSCGRCLTVRNFRAGGVHGRTMKVRIVHELSNEGLELDRNTFSQLEMDGRGTTEGSSTSLVAKYRFERC